MEAAQVSRQQQCLCKVCTCALYPGTSMLSIVTVLPYRPSKQTEAGQDIGTSTSHKLVFIIQLYSLCFSVTFSSSEREKLKDLPNKDCIFNSVFG